MDNQATKSAQSVEKLIRLYGSNGYAVGNSLTWADLAIFDVASTFFSRRPNFIANFPLISAVYERVLANENVASYVNNRHPTDNLENLISKAGH